VNTTNVAVFSLVDARKTGAKPIPASFISSHRRTTLGLRCTNRLGRD